MYSLGVMFFEMSYPPMLGMERAVVLEKIRRPHPELPSDFKPGDKTQTEIILSLLTHSPEDRPSSSELLKGGKLPVQMESETIRRVLATLSDPTSPYYQKVLSALFAGKVDRAADFAWDMSSTASDATGLLRQTIVKDILTSIFRRHGAVEAPRPYLYPRSTHFGPTSVQLLDPNGMLLQLPFNLTLGNARVLAKNAGVSVAQRSYHFGHVFRNRHDGGQPGMIGEVVFDVVTTDTLDLALKEAEVIKVLDEIISAFPNLSSSQMSFHLGHSDLLQVVFDYSSIEQRSRRSAAEILSKLNIGGLSWQKVRTDLRDSSVGVTATSVDELQRFDFRGMYSSPYSAHRRRFFILLHLLTTPRRHSVQSIPKTQEPFGGIG